jgi:hypothetical protein
MTKPRRFNLLVVIGGTRIVRFGVRRWTVGLALVVLGLGLAGLGVAASDYVALRAQRARFLAAEPLLAEQEARIAAVQGRLREMHAEVQGWRDMRRRIWQAFGPGTSEETAESTGIGGISAPVPGMAVSLADVVRNVFASATRPVFAPRAAIGSDLDRLTALVREESEGLRSLGEFLSRATRVLAALPSRWPLSGPVNSTFGRRTSPWQGGGEFHSGIDIGAAVGTAVHAPAPGTVVFAGRQPEYGITLVIDHGNDVKSLFGHLSALRVAQNQTVRRGDLVALSGNTGRSSGPHLHYEIQVQGQAVNPVAFLWD